MNIKNLNIVTEKVTDKTTGLPYWIAKGQGEIKPVVAYGPTRSEAFQYACTAIKEQGIVRECETLGDFEAVVPRGTSAMRPKPEVVK